MERLTALLFATVIVMSGLNSAALLMATLHDPPEDMTVTLDLEGLLPAGNVYNPEQTGEPATATKPEPPKINPRKDTNWVVSQLFSTNSYFVVGDDAYCTDVLGTAKISHGLALGGAAQNPEGRTDKILTRRERDQGNLIIVGGPGINPAAVEFGGYLGITYTLNHRVSFTIHCERRSIYLDLTKYPSEDICIIYLGKFDTRNVLMVWGYGWQGTYAGSMFMGDPANWEKYRGSHMLLLRWKDYNMDGLVQMSEITVEQHA
jgi:hypothetical protein